MQNEELEAEIERLKATFPGADENKVAALSGLIEQAAYERLYLKRLNEQAITSGLIKINPENATLQRTLPISGEITKHSATFTNILDKLVKHLGAAQDEEENELEDYE